VHGWPRRDEHDRCITSCTIPGIQRLIAGKSEAQGRQPMAEEKAASKGLQALSPKGRIDRRAHQSALTILTRLAQRRHMGEWLRKSLNERLESLAPIALEVAVETGDPIGKILAEELERSGDFRISLQLYLLSSNEKFRDSLTLHEVTRVVNRAVLSGVAGWGTPDDSASGLCELSRLLTSVDRFEEAVSVAERAVQLAEEGGQQELLASALSQLGLSLDLAGQFIKAVPVHRSAIDLYRKIAGTSETRWMGELAQELENLGFCFGGTGQYREAEKVFREALEIYRRLTGPRRPRIVVPVSSEADNAHHDALIQCNESEEAYRFLVRRYVDLTREDVVPFDQLARVLQNIGVALSEDGRFEEAITATREAASILRELEKARPDRGRRDLAEALRQLAFQLNATGLSAEALALAQESFEILQRLAENRPIIFAEDLERSSALLRLIRETLTARVSIPPPATPKAG
jgi:tetratricopeptide (TPR) repeat protein